MTVLLAAPSLPPSRPVLATPLTLSWTGWDGSVWPLTSPAAGLFLTAGVRGLSMPPAQRYTSDSPAVAGSRYRGHRALEREVFWPLHVYGDSSPEWLDRDRAFWRTMHPGRVGVWTVTQPSGESRTLPLRFVSDGDHSWATDPVVARWATYGITLVAEQPFWQGQPITRTWQAEDPVPFIGGGPDNPTGGLYVSSGSTLANATISNPGDEPTYPVWTITGPTDSVEVGVGGRVVEVPFPLAEGESLTIDTAPTAQTAFDQDGVERTAELGEVDFAPIEPGESVALSLNMVGLGTVTAEIRPLYHRAW